MQSLFTRFRLRQGKQIVLAVGGLKQGQSPEPQASGVFNRNLGYGAVPKSHEEGNGRLSLLRSIWELVLKLRFHPFISRDRQEGTRGMETSKVPSIVQNVQYVALNVPAAFIALH